MLKIKTLIKYQNDWCQTTRFHHHISLNLFIDFILPQKVIISVVASSSILDCVGKKQKSITMDVGWDDCRLTCCVALAVLSNGNIHFGDWIWLVSLAAGKIRIQLQVHSYYIDPAARRRYISHFMQASQYLHECFCIRQPISLVEEGNFPTTRCRARPQSVEDVDCAFLAIHVLSFNKMCFEDFLSLEKLWK